MALILCEDVPNWNSILRRCHKFCDIANGNARIILTMNDQKGLLHLLRVIERCDALHEFLHFRIAFVAELCPLNIASPALCVFDETRQVSNATLGYRSSDTIAIKVCS